MAWDGLLKTYKKESVLVGPVERMLLTRPKWEHREKQVIHPSELIKEDFCPRAVGYRILTGDVYEEDVNLVRQIIFDEGHEYHRKWQEWAWSCGLLSGRYRCLSCGYGDWRLDMPEWYTCSPKKCAECAAPRRFLQYGEVPIRSDEYLIGGSADGELPNHLLEIKSIGTGTVRMEAAATVARHTVETVEGSKVMDLWGIWQSIKQPFGDHVKQVNFYDAVLGLQGRAKGRALLVYEYKPGGAPAKEFDIRTDPVTAEPYLEKAAELKAACDREELLACPHKGCKKCEPYEREETTEPAGQDVRDDAVEGQGGSGGADVPDRTAGVPADPAGRRDRAERPGTDASVSRDDAVAGLLGTPSGRDGNRRRKRRQAPSSGGGHVPRYQRREAGDGR